MMKMRKLAFIGLLLTLGNLAPLPAYSLETPPPPSVPGTITPHVVATTTTIGTEAGIVAVAVSILGLIAYAASSGSGDSTPAATNH